MRKRACKRVGTGSWIVVAFGGNGGKGAERAFMLGGMGWVASVAGWLLIWGFVLFAVYTTVRTLRRRNGGTYLRYEVVVWQPEPHPGDLVVIVGLGVDGGRSRG